MSDLLIKGGVLGLIAGGLAACGTTPAYPITAPEPAQPAQAVAAPVPVQAAQAGPPAAQPAPAPGPVETQNLTPVGPPPETAPASQPTPEPPRPAAAAPRPVVAAPPPAPQRMGATGRVEPAKGMYRDYVVKKGDHIDEIARDLETTRKILLESNHLKDPNLIKPGMHLRIPVEKVYLAVKGDTMDVIARRFDVSAADLADLNGVSLQHRIAAGEQIALPGEFKDKGPVPLPSLRLGGRWGPGGYDDKTTRAYAPIETGPAIPTPTDQQVAAAGRGVFAWPAQGQIIARFGAQDSERRNDGIDIGAPLGTPVMAAAAGEVVYAGDLVPGFGNLILVKHADGWVTAYAHLDKIAVKMREQVAQGQQIGSVGQSGGVAEPQLHFEVRYAASASQKARPVDPQLVLPK